MDDKFKISMQFFGDESLPPETENVEEQTEKAEQPNSNEQKSNGTTGNEGKTFSQEEVDKIISERLSRQKEKMTKQFEDEKAEAAKLAKMNAEQKAEYEKQKREDELTAREKAVTMRELKAEAYNILAENNLPKELADILDYSSAENCNKSIDAVKKAFNTAVSNAVDSRLRNNNIPKHSNGNKSVDPFLEGLGV